MIHYNHKSNFDFLKPFIYLDLSLNKMFPPIDNVSTSCTASCLLTCLLSGTSDC